MGSINKVILIGNLGADPELKYTPSSRPLCNLRVATTEVFKDKAGVKQEKTEWHRVTVWGDQAENCSKYLSKGRSVYIEGKLQTRTYEKEGQKHYATDVVADRVVFLGGGGGGGEGGARRGGSGGGGSGGGRSGAEGGGGGGGEDTEIGGGGPPPGGDDDIPF
jgi:single-strand DNA-binding protein